MDEPALSTEAKFKLALMRVIDQDLKRRFGTLAAAAEFTDEHADRLSRIRCGRHELFSVNWLFQLADRAQVHIRISIDPVNR